MENEYIIINKVTIQKRIEELEVYSIHNMEVGDYDSEGATASELKEILSQSIPLIPEIEKAYTEGMLFGTSKLLNRKTKEDYISNLKLDI